jgi:hypothetical protein
MNGHAYRPAWSRPRIAGDDPATSGRGAPPPGRTADEVTELRTVVGTALDQVQDVVDLLTDLVSSAGRPGALAQVTAATHTLRTAASALESLTRPVAGERPPGARR